MSTSDLALVPRETRNNKHDKRKRRHVDQSLKRQERVAFKAKRNFSLDMEDETDTLY
jgi:hypothetical protein